LLLGVLTLHLLDAVSGIIIYSVVHKRASHPIHLVHSENWLLCSYYNDKTRRTEIASYELYDGNQLSNSTGIIHKILFDFIIKL
jgi:ER membrane protein complex subunit 1